MRDVTTSWRENAAKLIHVPLCAGIVAWLVLLMILWNGLSLPFLVLPTPLRPTRWGQWMAMLGARVFLATLRLIGVARFDLGELDQLRADGALIIAPNHPSLIDVLLIISRLPHVICVGKASLWRSPLLGPGMRLAGYLRNDMPVDLVRQAAARLRSSDAQLLLFPEGTRTDAPPLGSLRGGFALIAKRAGVPVQTVLLSVNSPFLSKSWPLLGRPSYPLVYKARLGRRFMVDGTVREFTPMVERYFRRELADGAEPRSGET